MRRQRPRCAYSYKKLVNVIASRYNALLVPLDDAFRDAAARRDAQFWSADGVHPTIEGHALIAGEWLRAVGASFGSK